MEEGKCNQGCDELEVLLEEIPNATSGSPQDGESGTDNLTTEVELISVDKRSFSLCSEITNFCNPPRAPKCGVHMTLPNGLIMQRNHRGRRDALRNDGESSLVDVDKGMSNLPDDRSLASALEELNFKADFQILPTVLSDMHISTCPNYALLPNGQYSIDLKKSNTSLKSGRMPTSPSNTIRRQTYPTNHGLEDYTSFRCTNGSNRFSRTIDAQDDAIFLKVNSSECEKQKAESLLSDHHERPEIFPMYSGAMPLNSGMNSFQIVPGVSDNTFEFPPSALQQQCCRNGQAQAYIPYQFISQSSMTWHEIEERDFRMQPQYVYLQQLQNYRSQVHGTQNYSNAAIRSFSGNTLQSHMEMSNPSQPEQGFQDISCHGAAISRGYNQSDETVMNTGSCRYYPKVLCSKDEGCWTQQSENKACSSSLTWSSNHEVMDKVGKQFFPEKILTKSHGVNSLRTIKSGTLTTAFLPCHVETNGSMRPDGNTHCSLMPGEGSLHGRNSQCLFSDNFESRPALEPPQMKYSSVNEVVGRIYSLAKDQNGCRFLQRILTEGTLEDVQKVFIEVIDDTVELMSDPFGNYLVQKLLEVCSEEQMMHIVHIITRNSDELIKISCSVHGTRAMQKLIETIRDPVQISMVVSALMPDTRSLMMDANGSHVAQRCLQYLLPKYRGFLFDTAIKYCLELAKDRQGCCVLQKCIYHSNEEQKHQLIYAITPYALNLSEDQYGNYAVQYILDQEILWATNRILDQLDGHYSSLSMQKYSSNVVEKCLKLAEDARRVKIIQELMNSPELLRMSQDQYGNYVIQSALKESKGTLHAALVDAIRPHAAALLNSSYGRRVLARTRLKNK
ncbi:uncharacterized protein [Typha angustifolia]|uniref:uncharacterized protein n=1 Tax=Typha angustifolia TaxID=59011 RepID=UPI003C2C8956